ncbi:MAG: hypothetical protein IIC67_03000 [Thaumarchaeota archaeon]|nr:hypothetical protein [Nitrososphaerota archaeon]
MNKSRFLILTIFMIMFSTIPIISAQEDIIPSWIKGIAGFWSEGKISDNEFLDALQFLINTGILTVKETQTSSTESNASNDNIVNQMTIQEPRENIRHQKNTFYVTVDDKSADEECRKLKNCFNPRIIKIFETDTIQVTNNGEIQHRLSSADRAGEPDHQQFYNQVIENGESFEYTYNRVGSYYVTCLNHPFMKLIVQVQPVLNWN